MSDVDPASAARPRPGGGTSVTRDRILDASEALFAARGFAATSVRDIAAEVGITAASLYNHFAGKEALYAAVLERGVRPLVALMRDLAARESTSESSDAAIVEVMEHLGRRPHLPRLIHQEAVTGGARLAGLAKEWVRPILEQGLAAMQHQPDSPWEREEQPLMIAAWIHLVLGHYALAPLFREVLGQDPLSPEMLARQTAFLRKLSRLLLQPGAAAPDPR
jgi:AcrR family transcriptional regulator